MLRAVSGGLVSGILAGVLAFAMPAYASSAASAISPPVSPLPSALSSELADAFDAGISGYSADGIAAMEASLAGGGAVPVFAAGAVGSGSAVLAGAAGGFALGALGVQAFYGATGQGATLSSGLCMDGLSLIAPLYGTDCSAITNQLAAVQANLDQAVSGSLSAFGWNIRVLGDVPRTSTQQYSTCLDLGTQSSTHGVTLWVNLAANPNPSGTSLDSAMGYLTKWSSTGQCPDTPSGYYYELTTSLSAGAHVSYYLTSGSSTSSGLTPSHANPSRTLVTTINGSDSSLYSCSSTTFTEQDPTIPDICAPTLPSGVTPESETVTEHTPDGSAPDKVLQSQSVTPAYQAAATAYPACATGSCLMQVYVGGAPCTVGEAECIDWQSDPASDDVTCEYGPSGSPTEYAPALSECDVLGSYYDPQAQAEGTAYADPSTGQSTGQQTSTDQDSEAMNQPGSQTNADGSNAACFPSGWGVLNPVNWVLMPIECAFRWAFDPDQAQLQSDFEGMRADWADTAPVEIISAVAGWNLQPVMTGCDGLTWVPPGVGPSRQGAPIQVADACPGQPLAPWAAWSFGITTVLAVVGGVAAFLSIGAGLFGMGGPADDN